MSFLDENMVVTDDPAKAEALAKKGVMVKLVDSVDEKLDPVGKEDGDIDNDGDVDSTDKYLANKRKAVAKAIMKSKKTIKKETLEEGILSKLLGGAAVLAGLFALGKINTSDSEIQALQAKYEQAQTEEEKDQIKDQITARLIFLDTGKEQVKEDAVDTTVKGLKKLDNFLSNAASGNVTLKSIVSNLVGSVNELGIENEEDRKFVEEILDKLKKEPEKEPFEKDSDKEKRFFKILNESKLSKKSIKSIEDKIKEIRDKNTTNENMSEDKKTTVELPSDTTFTLDLKHLMKKHMDEGKSREDTIKFTKALMAKLHNTGEVEIDGTKVKFIKEADVPQDAPLALPEPEVKKPRRKGPPRLVAFDTDQDSHFTGEDNYDYEGSMAKSQMLKMKKYAIALCDMIEDESQLESWLQAKITKASDYMSSVYHYLDYQRSKINEETLSEEAFNFPQADQYTLKKSKWGGEDGVGLDMPSSSKYREKDTDYILLKDTTFDNIDDLFNAFKEKLSNPNFTNDIFKRFADQTGGMILKNLKLNEGNE